MLEIRAGAGGDEAAIWAGDLARMYERYAQSVGWKVQPVSASEAELGGYKELILAIQGDGVFSQLKYEAGVHRVQRVPATESQGRVHTSTATVAVMPEADPVEVQHGPFRRSRRPEREQGGNRRRPPAQTHGHPRVLHPGAVPAPEPRAGHGDPAGQALRA
jgi:hypothetical protein